MKDFEKFILGFQVVTFCILLHFEVSLLLGIAL